MEVRRGRPPHPGPVTPAEERVLQLVREGLTNGEIAVRLGLTLNTVKYHVGNLLAKAGVDSREALQEWQIRDGQGRGIIPSWIPFARWLGVSGAAAGAVAVGFAGLAFVLAVGGSDDQRGVPASAVPPLSSADAVASASALQTVSQGPSLAPNRVPKVETVAIVDSDGPAPSVAIVDTASGVTLAQRATGYNPLVTFRRSQGELLLTHRFLFDGMTGREQVLEVLDLKDLSTKRVIPIPGRPEYTVGPGGAWQTLSNDDGTSRCTRTTTGKNFRSARSGPQTVPRARAPAFALSTWIARCRTRFFTICRGTASAGSWRTG